MEGDQLAEGSAHPSSFELPSASSSAGSASSPGCRRPRPRHGSHAFALTRCAFAGADFKRRRAKWRCPSGESSPGSVWIKADRLQPLIPRGSRRFRSLYHGRAAVEREFGRLKHEWGLAPLRVRGLAKVQLHADLVMLARLSQALARSRAVALAA